MILVCAASGRIGARVIELLRQTGSVNKIVAGVREVEKHSDLLREGILVRKVDYQEPESMVDAFEGVKKLLLIPSFAATDQRLIENLNVIKAAKVAGVKHISFVSIMDTRSDSPLSFARCYKETEEALLESGLKTTIFRTSMYTDNLHEQIPIWLKTNELVTCAGEGKISYVSRDDIAASLAAFLLRPLQEIDHVTYTLTGPEALSYSEVAKIVNAIYGTSIEMKHVSESQFRDEIKKIWGLAYGGKLEYILEQTAKFQVVFSQGMMSQVTSHVKALSGRNPLDVRSWLSSNSLGEG